MKWEILFQTIFNENKLDFGIQETESDLIIETNEENEKLIFEKLQKSLYSAASFQESLPYTVKKQTTSVPSKKILPDTQKIEQKNEEFIYPTETVDEIKKIVIRLFGDAFRECGLKLDDIFDTTAYVEEGVLFSKKTEFMQIVNIWEFSLNFLLQHFRGVSIERVRFACTQDNQALPRPEKDIGSSKLKEEMGIADSLIQKCFGIRYCTNPTTAAMIYVNWRQLFHFIFQPVITKRIIKSETSETIHKIQLIMPKQHLLDYLQQLTHDGVLLRVSQQNDGFFANPIFFRSGSSVNKPRHYRVRIDCSESMIPCFSALKENLLLCLEKLRTLDAEATVKITFFNHKIVASDTFLISDKEKISAFISKQEAWGLTRLFGSIIDEFKDILNNKATDDQNVTFIIFTDGYNDLRALTDEKEKKCNINDVQDTIAMFKTNEETVPLPKMFAVGQGNQHDDQTLSLIAQSCGGIYFNLKDINDFKQVYRDSEMIKTQRDFVEFCYQVAKEAKKFTLPLYHNGVQMPQIIIPLQPKQSNIITVNGNKVEITLDPTRVLQAGPLDQLQRIHVDALTSATDDTIATKDKIKKLTLLLSELEKVIPHDKKEAEQKSRTAQEVKEYIGELTKCESNERDLKSLNTMLQHRLGVIKPSLETKNEKKDEFYSVLKK